MINDALYIDDLAFRNRVVLQPMEGCDCRGDGAPDVLTREKYLSAARSGAGTVWFEAAAVCPEGRTNGRQMMLTPATLDAFKALVNDVYLTPVTVSSGQQPDVADLARSLKVALPDAILVDAAAIAREVGNDRTANMVIAGALSALTPFAEDLWHNAMGETFTGAKAKLLEVNEKAFALGRAAAMKR